MGPGGESPAIYDYFYPPINYANTGKPIYIKEDKFVGTKFNDMVDGYLKGRPAWVPSNSLLPLGEQKEQKIATQTIGYDECGQPYGFYLKGNVATSQYISNQPGTFLAILLRRLLESGVDVGPENEQRFNELLSSIGVACASDMLRYTQAGVLPKKTQVDAIVLQVTAELREWLAAELHEPSEAGRLNLFKILDKTYSLLDGALAKQEFSPDEQKDKKIKERSLARLRHHIDSVLLIASTDGTWKTKLWMSVGNAKLGGQLAEKASDRWGVNYAWTNLDPYALDPKLLIQRLNWWSGSVGKVANDAELLNFGIAELFKKESPTQRSERLEDIAPSNPAQKEALVRAVEHKVNDFIKEIANPATLEAGRKHLADYLVDLSNNLTTPENFENSGELLLAHVALGSLARILMLGSLLPQVLTCHYETDPARTVAKQNPFSGKTEIETVLVVRGGPDPADKIESGVFTDWLGDWMKSAHAGVFDVGAVTYNKAAGAYEIRFKAEVKSDWEAYSNTRLQIHVPTYLYDFSPADLGPSQPGVAIPESQLVWEWTGSADPFISPPRTPQSVSERTQKTMIQVPVTTTEYLWRWSANFPLMATPWMERGDSFLHPNKWQFPSDLERLTITKGIIETWGGIFGSEGWKKSPVYFSWLLQRWPDSSETDKYIKPLLVPPGPPTPTGPLSVSDVSRMAETLLAGATSNFLKTDMDTFRSNSLGWSRAWEKYFESRVFKVAATQDPSQAGLFERSAITYGSAAVGALLWETLPGILLYKGQSWVSDLKDRALLDALREQHWLGLVYDHSTEGGHQMTEIYAHYALGGYERWGNGIILPQISSPLYIDQAPFNFTLRNALTLYLHHAYDKIALSGETYRVSLGYYLAIGGIFSTRSLFGTSPASWEIGNYMAPRTKQDGGTELSNYGFSAKEFPGTMPVWSLGAKIFAEKDLSKKTTVSAELDLRPSTGDYYNMLKGVNWLWQRIGGGPDLDERLKTMGLDVDALVNPPPINFLPLGNPAAVQAEFDSIGVAFDAATKKSIANMKNSELAVTASGGRAFRVKKEGANYNIYDDPSMGNPNYLNPIPIADLRFGLRTEVPISKIFHASLGTFLASFGNEWQLNSTSLKSLYLQGLWASPDGKWAGRMSWTYDQSLRGHVNDYTLGAGYKYYQGALGDLLTNATINLAAGLRAFTNPVTGGSGGYSPYVRLTASVQINVPSIKEQVETNVYTQKTKSIMDFDCNGMVRDWQLQYGPIQTEKSTK